MRSLLFLKFSPVSIAPYFLSPRQVLPKSHHVILPLTGILWLMNADNS